MSPISARLLLAVSLVSASLTPGVIGDIHDNSVHDSSEKRDSSTPDNSLPCSQDKLVMYKVIFNTYWDRTSFPKQYPEWRPPAQWSKSIGEWPVYTYRKYGNISEAFNYF